MLENVEREYRKQLSKAGARAQAERLSILLPVVTECVALAKVYHDALTSVVDLTCGVLSKCGDAGGMMANVVEQYSAVVSLRGTALSSQSVTERKCQQCQGLLSQIREELMVLRTAEVEVMTGKLKLEAELEAHAYKEQIDRQANERIDNVCGAMERKYEEQTAHLKR